MNLLIYLAGVAEFLGIVGGIAFLVLFFWLGLSRRGRLTLNNLAAVPEYRCGSCVDAENCLAADTGVCYPCPYYEKKDKP